MFLRSYCQTQTIWQRFAVNGDYLARKPAIIAHRMAGMNLIGQYSRHKAIL
jgi:hypothetical protein